MIHDKEHSNYCKYKVPYDKIGYIIRLLTKIKTNSVNILSISPLSVNAEFKVSRVNNVLEYYKAILPFGQNSKIKIQESKKNSKNTFIEKNRNKHSRINHPSLMVSESLIYSVVTRYILGIRPTINGLIIDPCIPSDWNEFEVTQKWRGATYKIKVQNPESVMKGIRSVFVNNKECSLPIPIQKIN